MEAREARLLGLTTYTTGRACKRGHFAARYTKTGLCQVCTDEGFYREKQKKSWDKHRERVLAERKNDPVLKERHRQNQKRYHENNKAERNAATRAYYARNSEQLKAYQREYRAANPEKVKAWQSRRYRAVKHATPSWLTYEQWFEMVRFYANRPDGYEVDHIVPIKGENACGLHVPWNLQYLPVSENRRKKNKLISE